MIDYFPINKALDLKDTNSDDERRLAELKTMMKAMMDKMWSMQVKMFAACRAGGGGGGAEGL